MHIAIDVVLLAIVVYCGWRGYRNGIIRGICGLLAIVIALYGANLVASVYSSEFNGMLNPFMSGIVDSAVSTVINGGKEEEQSDRRVILDEEDEEEEEKHKRSVMILTDEEKEDVYSVCFASLRYLGLSEDAADMLAKNTADETSQVGQQMNVDLTNKICVHMAYVITFLICFILLAILFAVVGNIIDLTFAIPGIEKVEPYIGIVIGLARGVLLILVIAVFFRYAGLAFHEDTFEKTRLLKRLMESGLIAERLGL
ncbi:MAG: CvpA family protein [Oscillospiraceae bacterium]|nr:CvpA family protein [Oscillospiraceae bacterium]